MGRWNTLDSADFFGGPHECCSVGEFLGSVQYISLTGVCNLLEVGVPMGNVRSRST